MFQLVKFLFKFLFKSFPLLQEVVSLKIYAKAHSDTTKEVEEIVEELQTAIDDAREKVEMDTKQFRQDLEKAYRDKVHCTCYEYACLCCVYEKNRTINDFICIFRVFKAPLITTNYEVNALHSCQPSRNGRDSPGRDSSVPVVSRLVKNTRNVPEFFTSQ